MSFVDIVESVRGASEGRALVTSSWRISVKQTRSARSRSFDDGDVVHVDGKVSPTDDIETINTELISPISRRWRRRFRGWKRGQAQQGTGEGPRRALLAQTKLNEGQTVSASGIDREPLRELFLLTAKPFLRVNRYRSARRHRIAHAARWP